MSHCRRFLFFSVISLLMATTTGCSTFTGIRDYIAYNDATNQFVMGWRNEVWAQQSWHENKHLYADQPYKADFGIGYRDGYAAVASGGNGCPPPLPPRKYWRWHYETPEGRAKIAAWSAGYPHGAAAAEQDSAGQWTEIPVSRSIELQYSPEFEQGTMFLPPDVSEQYYGPNGPANAAGMGVSPNGPLPPSVVPSPSVPSPLDGARFMGGARDGVSSPGGPGVSPEPRGGQQLVLGIEGDMRRLPATPELADFPHS